MFGVDQLRMDENRATWESSHPQNVIAKRRKWQESEKDDRPGTSMAPETSSGYHHSLTREYLAEVL